MLGDITDYLFSSTIGDFFSESIRNASQALIFGKYSDLGNMIQPTLAICLTISMTIYGIKFMMGEAVSTLKQLITTCVWVVFGLTVITPEIFYNWLYLPFFSIRDAFTSFLMFGDPSETIYASFSNANSRMFSHAANIFEAAGMTDFSMIINAVVIFIIYGLYYAGFLAVTMFFEFSTNILLLLSVIIIPISGFQSARGLAKSMVVALLKYFTVFVVLGLIVNLMNVISSALVSELMAEVYTSKNGTMNDGSVKLDSPILGATLAIGTLGIYMMYKAMEFSTELTGGALSDGKEGATALSNGVKNSMSGMGSMGQGMGSMGKGGMAAYKAAKAKLGKN